MPANHAENFAISQVNSFASASTSIIFFLCRKQFRKITDNYNKTGHNTTLWDFLFYSLCGIIITLSVHMAGVVIVFCFLIIPATISVFFTSQWNKQFIIISTISTIESMAGLLFSHWLDFSAGVSVALFLCIFLITAIFIDKITLSQQ